MISAILTLILAPLSIALLVLYLQQLSKVSELRSENDALKVAAKKAKEDSECFQHLLMKARDYYGERVDSSDEEKRKLNAIIDRWEDFGKDTSDIHMKVKFLAQFFKKLREDTEPLFKSAQPVDTSNGHNQPPTSS